MGKKSSWYWIRFSLVLFWAVQRNPERAHRRKNSQFIRLSILGVILTSLPPYSFVGPNGVGVPWTDQEKQVSEASSIHLCYDDDPS